MKRHLGLLILFLCACSSLPTSLEKPDVNLQQVEVSDASLTNADLVFNFLVKNPNPIPVSVDKVDYALNLNGRPFTKGALEKGLKVGAHESVMVPLPINVKYSDLSQSVVDILQRGSTKYQLKGSVKVGLFSIPFEQTGNFNLSELSQ